MSLYTCEFVCVPTCECAALWVRPGLSDSPAACSWASLSQMDKAEPRWAGARGDGRCLSCPCDSERGHLEVPGGSVGLASGSSLETRVSPERAPDSCWETVSDSQGEAAARLYYPETSEGHGPVTVLGGPPHAGLEQRGHFPCVPACPPGFSGRVSSWSVLGQLGAGTHPSQTGPQALLHRQGRRPQRQSGRAWLHLLITSLPLRFF